MVDPSGGNERCKLVAQRISARPQHVCWAACAKRNRLTIAFNQRLIPGAQEDAFISELDAGLSNAASKVTSWPAGDLLANCSLLPQLTVDTDPFEF